MGEVACELKPPDEYIIWIPQSCDDSVRRLGAFEEVMVKLYTIGM